MSAKSIKGGIALKLKPLHDHVVLEPEKEENKTKSGIILTSKDNERPQTAQVVAVGPGEGGEKMSVTVGQTVVFKQYTTTEVTFDDKKYLIVKESDILAIVEGA